MSKKMTKKEFQNYIISEATKLYKIEVLKERKESIDKELRMFNEDFNYKIRNDSADYSKYTDEDAAGFGRNMVGDFVEYNGRYYKVYDTDDKSIYDERNEHKPYYVAYLEDVKSGDKIEVDINDITKINPNDKGIEWRGDNEDNFGDEVSDIEGKYNINKKYDDYFAESKIKSVNEGATIGLNENTGDLDSQLSTASMIAAEKIMYDVSDRLSSVDKTFTDDYQNQEKMKVVWNEIEEKLSDTIFELFKNGINKLKDATTDLEANGGDEVKKQFDNMFDNPLGQLDDLSASFGPKNESKMTKQDFKNYIISEATKLYKIEVLKEQKNNIDKQFKMLNENEFGDDFERESREVEHDINPHKELSSEEQRVLDDILNGNLNEGFDSIVQKVKQYASKGMLTAGIIAALMSTPGIASAQKAQIKQVAKTEMSQKKETNFFSTKEWSAIKNAGVKSHAKVLKFKDYDGYYEETLNFGGAKTKGLPTFMAVGLDINGTYTPKGTIIIDFGTDHSKEAIATIKNIVSALEKAGLGSYREDNYGGSMESYRIPLKDYQNAIKIINMAAPVVK